MAAHSTSSGPYTGLLSGFLKRERLRHAAHFIVDGQRVLDLGCYDGALLSYLPGGAAVEYVGVDIDPIGLEQGRAAYPQHRFLQADLTQPATFLADEIFDVIVMLAFLEHIPDPSGLLREFAPYLAPNGMIVTTTPAPYGRHIHDVGAKIGLFSQDAADEHETFLGRAALNDIAVQAGLKMSHYQRFLLGFNQLACFTHPA